VLVDAISLVLDQRAIYKAAGSLIEPAHRETDHSRVYFSARDSVRAKPPAPRGDNLAIGRVSDCCSARRKKNGAEGYKCIGEVTGPVRR
jgi:hypothetical protein